MSPKAIFASVGAAAVALLSLVGVAALPPHAVAGGLGLDPTRQIELTQPGTWDFGNAVAVSGNTMLVGDQEYSPGPAGQSGAVFVYIRSGNDWSLQATLTDPGNAMYDCFGCSVALSGDSAVIGAADGALVDGVVGAAYVFTRTGTVWSQQAKLVDPDGAADYFGLSVAVSGDTAVVGARCKTVGGQVAAGAAYVFTRTGTSWSQSAELDDPNPAEVDWFGSAVSLSGDTALITAPRATVGTSSEVGVAYVFNADGTNWTEQEQLVPADAAAGEGFGTSAALSGNSALIGAPDMFDGNVDNGMAYVFSGSGGSWSQTAEIADPEPVVNDYFGCSVALSDESHALIGAWFKKINDNRTGAAYLFSEASKTWSQAAELLPSASSTVGGQFGCSVALSSDTAAVGAPGAVYVDPLYGAPAVTIIGAGSSWQASTVPLSVNASVDSALSLADVQYSTDGGKTWSDVPGDGLNRSISVSSQGVTDLVVRATDSDGQTGDASATVKIDAETPTVTITGADASWHRQPINLTLTPSTGPSGVTAVQEQLDSGSWTPVMSVNGGYRFTVSRNGSHAVGCRVISGAGVVGSVKQCQVRVDDVRPIARLRTTTAKPGTIGALSLDITKYPPGCGRARVAIAFYRDGHLKGSLTTNYLRVNAWTSVRWKCTLAGGRYVVHLRATDAAGNRQATPTTARLVVR